MRASRLYARRPVILRQFNWCKYEPHLCAFTAAGHVPEVILNATQDLHLIITLTLNGQLQQSKSSTTHAPVVKLTLEAMLPEMSTRALQGYRLTGVYITYTMFQETQELAD